MAPITPSSHRTDGAAPVRAGAGAGPRTRRRVALLAAPPQAPPP